MCVSYCLFMFFFSSRRRHTRWPRDWSSDVCSSDLAEIGIAFAMLVVAMLIALRLSKASQLARELSWRSEERRVGKECRSRWRREQCKRDTRRNEKQREDREKK